MWYDEYENNYFGNELIFTHVKSCTKINTNKNKRKKKTKLFGLRALIAVYQCDIDCDRRS